MAKQAALRPQLTVTSPQERAKNPGTPTILDLKPEFFGETHVRGAFPFAFIATAFVLVAVVVDPPAVGAVVSAVVVVPPRIVRPAIIGVVSPTLGAVVVVCPTFSVVCVCPPAVVLALLRALFSVSLGLDCEIFA